MAAEKPWKPSDCRLVLEDGSVWPGQAFGAQGTAAAAPEAGIEEATQPRRADGVTVGAPVRVDAVS